MPPQTLPLLQASDMTYVGRFAFSGATFAFGGLGLGMGEDGASLYVCPQGAHALGRISIPAINGTATTLLAPVPVPTILIDPTDPNDRNIRNSLIYNGRLIISAVSYYDADSNQLYSHFWATPNVGSIGGPVRFTAAAPGLTGGYMGHIPAEWQPLLGGPCYTGVGGLAIVSRTSSGPPFIVFDPDDLGVTAPVPSTMLLGYPSGQAPLAGWGTQNPLYNGTTVYAGTAFPSGTRSVLFMGRHGDGPFCYGGGTACGDPTNNDQGTHAFPYYFRIWAYDANDLLAVKQGTKNPWDCVPYAYWNLPELNSSPGFSVPGYAEVRSACYDDATRRLYICRRLYDNPFVNVYEIAEPSPPDPPTDVPGTGMVICG